HLPLVEHEILDRSSHVAPERFSIRLEDGPLRAFVNRVFEVSEVATQVHIFPLGIGADRARAPQPETSSFEEAETVDAFRIKNVLLRLVEQLLKTKREIDD